MSDQEPRNIAEWLASRANSDSPTKEATARPTIKAEWDPKFVPLVNSMGASALGLIGVLLCCTIIGAVIGIPLIIATLKGPKKGGYVGPCPHCGSRASVALIQAGANCRGCKRRIVVKDGHFVGF